MHGQNVQNNCRRKNYHVKEIARPRETSVSEFFYYFLEYLLCRYALVLIVSYGT
jgi:hypothetical protein